MSVFACEYEFPPGVAAAAKFGEVHVDSFCATRSVSENDVLSHSPRSIFGFTPAVTQFMFLSPSRRRYIVNFVTLSRRECLRAAAVSFYALLQQTIKNKKPF